MSPRRTPNELTPAFIFPGVLRAIAPEFQWRQHENLLRTPKVDFDAEPLGIGFLQGKTSEFELESHPLLDG